MTKETERLKAQAIRVFEKHETKKRELAQLEKELKKACADYGKSAGMWGFSPVHLRILLEHERVSDVA